MAGQIQHKVSLSSVRFILCVPHSPLLSLGLLVGTIVTLIALIIKRHDTPTNYYLLIAFVSHVMFPTMAGYGLPPSLPRP